MLKLTSHLGDYATAASYFAQLAHLYAQDSWTRLELNMLNMYAYCLKHVNQNEDYIQIGLKIVAKLNLEHPTQFLGTLGKKTSSLTDLISASAAITHRLTVPMGDYFGCISVDPYVRPYGDHDGFYLQLLLTNLTSDAVKAQEVRVKLVPVDEDHQTELWLVTTNVTLRSQGAVSISVGTKVCEILLFIEIYLLTGLDYEARLVFVR